MRTVVVSLLLCLLLPVSVLADTRQQMLDYLDEDSDRYAALARAIWDRAELGYLETESTALLQQTLAAEGFEIEAGVAGIPTSFVASYGSGKPVIGFLAEFDALPGISQADVPVRQEIEGKHAGHACGHHLFGAGSTAAAVAVKRWMQQNNIAGTVRLYGTPAEEGGSGKVYMVRGGLFDDVDAVLVWHPADRNMASPSSTLANKSAKFRFRGVASHAAIAPERGRSALDGVEAMNFMTNMLREHIPQTARMHYVITAGGTAPNVVPEFAEVFYYVRHPSAAQLKEIWARVEAAAQGAALGSGTELEIEVIHGNQSILTNEALAEVMHRNLTRAGGPQWSKEELAFAARLAESLPPGSYVEGQEKLIQPMTFFQSMGSTDVGDVSWTAPTIEMRAATWVPGTAPHTWQAIAAGGTSVGSKGMMVAARTLSLAAGELMTNPELLAAARAEFEERRGADWQYEPLLGDRDPPLDYRVGY